MNRRAVDALMVTYYSTSHPRGNMFRKISLIWEIPANTHTGMYDMFAMQEAIRQVRGEAAHQVPDVKVSFCQGVGGMFTAAGSLVFTNEPPPG